MWFCIDTYLTMRAVSFLESEEQFVEFRRRLKQTFCPACGAIGFLICHGYLYGHSGGSSEKVLRGQRFYCSNRNLRKGCGRTFSILLSSCLRNRQVSSSQLWCFVSGVVQGLPRFMSWKKAAPSFSSTTGYRLWHRWFECQSSLRVWLCRKKAPPLIVGPLHPTCQLLKHLQSVFASASCMISAFQHSFQQAILG